MTYITFEPILMAWTLFKGEKTIKQFPHKMAAIKYATFHQIKLIEG